MKEESRFDQKFDVVFTGDIDNQLEYDKWVKINEAANLLEEVGLKVCLTKFHILGSKGNEYKLEGKQIGSSLGNGKSFERWHPAIDEKYFYISGNHHIAEDTFTPGFSHRERHAAFNCFKTHKEAEHECDIRQLWFELREYARIKNIGYKHDKNEFTSVGGIKFYNDSDAYDAREYFKDRIQLLYFLPK